jgi:hypothetical protein
MVIENILTTIEMLLILFIFINAKYIKKSIFFILVIIEIILNIFNEYSLILDITHIIYFIALTYYAYFIIRKKQVS